jgi:hypothetical protein
MINPSQLDGVSLQHSYSESPVLASAVGITPLLKGWSADRKFIVDAANDPI